MVDDDACNGVEPATVGPTDFGAASNIHGIHAHASAPLAVQRCPKLQVPAVNPELDISLI